ncbi:MAG: PEP-CTERM sorting domain-containing protein [Verrucomicrobiaceae bacterium]
MNGIPSITLIVFLALSVRSEGVLVRLEFEGVVDEVIQGSEIGVGDRFQMTTLYEVPRELSFSMETWTHYARFPAESQLLVGGRSFVMPGLTVNAGEAVDGSSSGVGWSTSTLLGDLEPSNLGWATFSKPGIFLSTREQLPESLGDWDLVGTDFVFRFLHEDFSDGGYSVLEFTSMSYSNLSIAVVPEPGAVLLSGTGLSFLLKRKRGVGKG